MVVWDMDGEFYPRGRLSNGIQGETIWMMGRI